MASTTEEVKKPQPSVLPANFAAWDDNGEIPDVLPDDFDDFDQESAPQQTPAVTPVPAPAPVTARAASVAKPAAKETPAPEKIASVSKSSETSARAGRSESAASGSWKDVKADKPASQPQTKVQTQSSSSSYDYDEEEETPSGNKNKLILIVVGVVVVLGGIGAATVMHKSSSTASHPAGTTAAGTTTAGTVTGGDKPAAGTPTDGAAANTTASTAQTPQEQQQQQQQQQQDQQQQQQQTARPVNGEMMAKQLNAPTKIAGQLKQSGDAPPPPGQVSFGDYGNSGGSNVFGHSQSPNVKMAVPGQANVSTSEAMNYVIRKQPAAYPQIAQKMHVQGTVQVQIVVSKTGSVVSAHAINGPVVLRQAAEASMAGWKFRPYLISNQPVEMHTVTNIDFMLGH